MKKKLLQFIFTTTLVIVFISPILASEGLSVTLLGFEIDSTLNVNLGYKLTISAEVKNTDSTQAFIGNLDFGLRNSTQELSNEVIFNKPSYSTNQITLAPGEVVPAIFSIDIESPYFIPGPDVVVVWPISTSPIKDSIRLRINIENPNSMNEPNTFAINYILSDEQIIFNGLGSESNIQQVRIYSTLAQQVYAVNSNFIKSVSIQNLPTGIYFCEFITATGNKRIIKFFH